MSIAIEGTEIPEPHLYCNVHGRGEGAEAYTLPDDGDRPSTMVVRGGGVRVDAGLQVHTRWGYKTAAKLTQDGEVKLFLDCDEARVWAEAILSALDGSETAEELAEDVA